MLAGGVHWHVRKVSACGRFKMLCLYVTGTILLSVHLREVSAYGRLKMQCLYVAEVFAYG